MMALLTVGIGECKVSTNPSDVLVTHSLGSCIAVILYDPIARVAGLLHYMLPESSLDPDTAARRPFLFADTGIPLLLQNVYQLGAVKSRFVVMVAGGARMLDPRGIFNIGQRNHVVLREILRKAEVVVNHEEIGGTSSRTIRIEVACGRVHLSTSSGTEHEIVVNSKKIGAGDGLENAHPR